MNQHARIGFSSLARTVQCEASVTLCESVPPLPPTEDSLEGDAAHYVAARYAEGFNVPEGSKAPNGIEVTREMIDGGIMWRDEVGMYGLVEVPCVATRIHPTDCWGTPDFRRWDPIAMTLRMKDYKWGHKFVEVFECWQLIGGACAALEELGLTALEMEQVTLDFAIVQPNSYHREGPVRHWTISARNLTAYINIAFNAAHAALGPSPQMRTGDECEYCPARHVCTALQAQALSAVEYVGLAETLNLPPAALGRELSVLERAAEMLDARITGLREQAASIIASGERVPGYGMEQTAGRLKWLGTVAEVVAFGDAIGVDLRQDPKVITPTQAKDRKLLDAEAVKAYSERPLGGMKLTRISSTGAAKAFGI